MLEEEIVQLKERLDRTEETFLECELTDNVKFTDQYSLVKAFLK